MISLIEALNYRCLRYVRQPLKPFHVLVGPNASGKSTFLDVLGFLHDLVTDGLVAAIEKRSANFYDLLWRHEGKGFELAIEAAIPATQRQLLAEPLWDTVRYELAVELDVDTNNLGIVAERGLLKVRGEDRDREAMLRPDVEARHQTLFTLDDAANERWVFRKWPAQRRQDLDLYEPEVASWHTRETPGFPLNLGTRKSAIANLPEDESQFPATTWLKGLLVEGVQPIALNAEQLGRASPPGSKSGFKPDGSNLPWVVADLERKSPERHKEWIKHLQTALPDLINVTTIDRPEDRHRYLMLEYRDGLKVPSWMVSDGTLRLLALTLPAYLGRFEGIYLVEEPENGIHPLAIETMYQSLSSVYDAQVLLATHSPIVLGITKLEDVLCFRKDEAGASEVVLGTKHPELRDWHGEVNLGTLFASGVLG